MRFFSESGSEELAQWVRKARAGDRRAWDSLVDRFQNLVYSIARREGLDTNDAADVFQSTFLALYRSLDRIEEPATLPKWLAVTAARESLRIKRFESRYVHESPDGPGLADTLVDTDSSPDDLAVNAVEGDLLRTLLQHLGGRCEQLLAALYFDDKSYEEVVADLGIPMGAIGPTRARCLEKLRKMYQKEGGLSHE